VDLTLAIFGIGALVAVTGGIMYVTVVLVSILTGPRVEANQLLLVAGTNNPLLESTKLTDRDLEHPKNQPRGTLVIVIAFLVWFAMYYLGNWWLLGRTWFIK
jgi:cytochrome c oxidase subunit 1